MKLDREAGMEQHCTLRMKLGLEVDKEPGAEPAGIVTGMEQRWNQRMELDMEPDIELAVGLGVEQCRGSCWVEWNEQGRHLDLQRERALASCQRTSPS